MFCVDPVSGILVPDGMEPAPAFGPKKYTAVCIKQYATPKATRLSKKIERFDEYMPDLTDEERKILGLPEYGVEPECPDDAAIMEMAAAEEKREADKANKKKALLRKQQKFFREKNAEFKAGREKSTAELDDAMRAKLAKLVEDAKVLEHAQKAKREVSVAKFKEEQAALTKKMKAAKIETDRRIEEARKQREAELKKGDQVRAELGAERIKEKKADLKKMREKAAARKAEFEAMMNAADGAGSVSLFLFSYGQFD
jgi:dGTP triphosphohydrolase